MTQSQVMTSSIVSHDPMSCHIWSKNDKWLKKAPNIAMLSRMQMKSIKIRIMNSSLKWLTWIFTKIILLPKKLRNWTFYVTFYFFFVQNTRQYVVETCLEIWHAKFPVDISILGKHVTRAAEFTIFKRLRLRLRLQPENIDSDSNSDSTSTPA